MVVSNSTRQAGWHLTSSTKSCGVLCSMRPLSRTWSVESIAQKKTLHRLWKSILIKAGVLRDVVGLAIKPPILQHRFYLLTEPSPPAEQDRIKLSCRLTPLTRKKMQAITKSEMHGRGSAGGRDRIANRTPQKRPSTAPQLPQRAKRRGHRPAIDSEHLKPEPLDEAGSFDALLLAAFLPPNSASRLEVSSSKPFLRVD